MLTMFPALRGKFGETEYCLSTMHVGEAIRLASSPDDVPDWECQSVEERCHRDIDLSSVRKSIAPYFANDPARFSGAVALAVIDPDDTMAFEPLTQFAGRSSAPALYQAAAANMGFLTLTGDETLVPLDGPAPHQGVSIRHRRN